MIKEYSAVFGNYRDAVIIVNDGTVEYANTAAKRTLAVSEGMDAYEVFPAAFLEVEDDKFSCALTLNGADFSALSTKTDGVRVVTLYQSEDGGLEKMLLNDIGAKLRERVAEIKMASGILTPYIEQTGNEKMIRYNNIINKAGYVLQRMVGNMTYLEGCDSDKFSPANTDLNELIESAADSASAFLGDTIPEIKCDFFDRHIILYADRRKLLMAVLQLLSNSLKNTPPDGKINISVKKVKSCIVIEVADTGRGIDEDKLGDIWSSGRHRDTSAGNGVGTGLAIVQKIARIHDGMALLASTPGKGTKVSVILPIKKGPDNILSAYEMKFDSGLENIMVQLADVIPYERFGEKYTD